MAEKENTAQEVMKDLITDPDSDAERVPPPQPPQTIANEPSGSKGGR